MVQSRRFFFGARVFAFAVVLSASAKSPNVVLIITDDQGYGDLGAHGNTMLRTPHLDTLAKQSRAGQVNYQLLTLERASS